MSELADWMESTDVLILEYLRKEGSDSRMAVEGTIDGHPEHIGSRVRELTDHGLLKKQTDRTYTLSDRGQEYLTNVNVDDH